MTPDPLNCEDTIVAPSTAPGRSAQAIVRLSGPRALDIAGNAAGLDLSSARPYTSRECRIAIDGVDVPCILYLMPGPKSYTREDVAEVHTFGAPPLVGAIMNRLLDLGARAAEPGEFTRRAFFNGRIDLAQAEAVLSIIRSHSTGEEFSAQRVLAGELSETISTACGALEELCIQTEASIDFVEHGTEAVTPTAVETRLRDILARLPDPGSDYPLPLETGVVTVIVGKTNAGKSTIFNALAGADHALVSAVSGTTRDWLSAEIQIEDITFLLVDTAGQAPPVDELTRQAQQTALDQQASAQITMLVVDGSETFDPNAIAEPNGGATLVVLSKSDLPAAADRHELARVSPGVKAVSVSTLTGKGMDQLRKALAELVTSGSAPGGAHHAMLSARQRDMILRARASLERGIEACNDGLDLAASDIRDALTSLGSVLGWGATEEILDAIFSDFCIGK